MGIKQKISSFKKYTIGEIKYTRPDFKMVKTSIFCSPRGFIIFLLALTSFADSYFLKDEKRKKEALYAMYHNVIPFLEVTCVMIPIMIIMHKRVGKLSNLSSFSVLCITPLICITSAFFICMTLRMLGIRKDCCNDINYDQIFNEKGFFQGFSFKLPRCKKLKENIPKYFYHEGDYIERNTNIVHSSIFKFLYSVLSIPLFFIYILDFIVRYLIDIISYPFTRKILSDDRADLQQKSLPFSFCMLLISLPFCEKTIGKYFNEIIAVDSKSPSPAV